MKTTQAVILVFFGLFIQTTLLGQYYEFSKENRTYFNLAKPSLTNDTSWSGWAITFEEDSPKIKLFGRAAIPSQYGVAVGGYVIVTTDSFSFAIDPLICDMQKRTSSSRISYGKTLFNGDTVHVFEWRNMGLVGHPTTDSVNFQLWCYRRTEHIEFVYGPSHVTADSAFQGWGGILVTLNWLTKDFTGAYEQYYVKGDPESPEFVFNKGQQHLVDVPESGTVYRFKSPKFAFPTSSKQKMDEGQDKLILYPNPTSGEMKVEWPAQWNASFIILRNLKGETVLEKPLQLDQSEVSLSRELDAGLYFLEIKREDETIAVQKVTVP